MLTKNLLVLKLYASLNVIDSTNGTMGVCVILCLTIGLRVIINFLMR